LIAATRCSHAEPERRRRGTNAIIVGPGVAAAVLGMVLFLRRGIVYT